MDLSIVYYINHLEQGTIIDTLSLIVSTKLFIAILRVAVVGLVSWKCKKKRRFVLLAFLVSGVVFYLIGEGGFKNLFTEIRGIKLRPYLAHPDLISSIGHRYTDTSFPSNHMANILALFTVAVYFIRRSWPIGLFFALIMAFSRMHNGMHYPIDVVVGALWGIVYGLVAIWLARKFLKK